MAKEKVVKDNAERWLLTYADLMNLLLILFILLFAMSQVDKAKFDQLAESLRDAFGVSTGEKMTPVSGGGTSVIPLPNTVNSSTVIKSKMEQQQMNEVQEKVGELVKKGNLDGKIDVQMQERGIVISITAQMLFKPGEAEIVAGSRPTIQEIGMVLKGIPGNQIRIEGHTDTDPISSGKYPSNWYLSSARATNVLQLLVDQVGIDPNMIAATAYGQTRPIVANTTAVNKAKNRRVNIVILKNIYDAAEPTAVTGDNVPSGNTTENAAAGNSETQSP